MKLLLQLLLLPVRIFVLGQSVSVVLRIQWKKSAAERKSAKATTCAAASSFVIHKSSNTVVASLIRKYCCNSRAFQRISAYRTVPFCELKTKISRMILTEISETLCYSSVGSMSSTQCDMISHPHIMCSTR